MRQALTRVAFSTVVITTTEAEVITTAGVDTSLPIDTVMRAMKEDTIVSMKQVRVVRPKK